MKPFGNKNEKAFVGGPLKMLFAMECKLILFLHGVVYETKGACHFRQESPAARDARRRLKEWLDARSYEMVDVTTGDGALTERKLRGVGLGL